MLCSCAGRKWRWRYHPASTTYAPHTTVGALKLIQWCSKTIEKSIGLLKNRANTTHINTYTSRCVSYIQTINTRFQCNSRPQNLTLDTMIAKH